MEAPIGLGQGLAFTVDYNERINQLHRNEDLDRRARNDAEARAAMFARETEYDAPMNNHDAPIVKERARAVIRKMGEYRRNNPDLMYNPDKLVQFNELKRELKENPELIRGVSSDKSYSDYTKDLQEVAKNPQMYDTEAYENIGQQWNNYLKFGNQNGAEAAMAEGKKAFLYTKPQPFVADLPGTLLKIGDGIKDYNVVKSKNGDGEWWTEAKPGQLKAARESAYAQYKRQLEVFAKKNGMTTQGELDKWVEDNISAGIKKNYHGGDLNAAFDKWYKMQMLDLQKDKLKAKQGPGYSTWEYMVDPNTKAGQVSTETIRKTWGDKPQMVIVGNNGAKTDLTGYEWYPNQKFVKRNGIPFLLGYTKIPAQVAAQKGIISEYDPDDETAESFGKTSGRITSEYLGTASWATDLDKNGKAYNYITVSYNLPVNPNDQIARQRFNVFNDVDKLVPAAQNPYAGQSGQKRVPPSGAGVDEKGNVFDSSGKFIGPITDFE